MKVFISWSGDLSKKVAEVLHDWIEDTLQGTDVWISTDDIDKGSLWFSDIANGLSETGVGILCLTKDNVSAPWLLFEAGALSKGLTKSRVCPFLVNLTPADLKQPLSQFNATMPTKDDMLKLVRTINSQKGDKALTDDRLSKAFDRWWGDFETKFTDTMKSHKTTKVDTHRSPQDMIEEVLEIVRSLQNSAQMNLAPSISYPWLFKSSSPFEHWIEAQAKELGEIKLTKEAERKISMEELYNAFFDEKTKNKLVKIGKKIEEQKEDQSLHKDKK